MSCKVLVGSCQASQAFWVVTFILPKFDKSFQHGGTESKQGLQEFKIIVRQWEPLIPDVDHAVFRAKGKKVGKKRVKSAFKH